MSEHRVISPRTFIGSAVLYLLLAGTASVLLFVLPAVSVIALKVVAFALVGVLVICLLTLYFWFLSKPLDVLPALRRSAEVLALAAVLLTAVSALVALICVLIYFALQNLLSAATLKTIIDSLIALSIIAIAPFLLNLLAVFATSTADLKARLKESFRIGAKRYLALLALTVAFALVLGLVLWQQNTLSIASIAQIIGTILLAVTFGSLLTATFWASVRFAPPPPKKKAQLSAASLPQVSQPS